MSENDPPDPNAVPTYVMNPADLPMTEEATARAVAERRRVIDLAASRAATTDKLIVDLPTPTATASSRLPSVPAPALPRVVIAPESDPFRLGWRTSEFYVGAAALLLSAAYANGLITSNTGLAIAGMASTILGALGYTVCRTALKAKQ